MNNRGLITFYVPQGQHNISVIFTEDTVRLISDIISLTALLIAAILVGIQIVYRKK
jgi:hypothetical protein